MPAALHASTRRRLSEARSTGLFLAPGLLDAGFASLAGFISAFYAARMLDPAALGAYALYFWGFVVASAVPLQLYFQPAQVAVLPLEERLRLAVAPAALRVGVGIGLLTALLVVWVGALSASQVPTSVLVGLAATNVALIIVSPAQDFVRSALHLGGASPAAAAMSATQLTVASITALTLHFGGAPRELVPFGALAVANLVSTTVGMLYVRRALGGFRVPLPAARTLLREGRPLLGWMILPPAAVLGGSAIVAVLVSAEAVGHAEAARVVAMPVLVFGQGILQVLRPRLMEAGAAGLRPAVLRQGAFASGVVVVFSVAYIAVAGWPHPLNLPELLLPAAFTLGALPLVRILELLVGNLTFVPGGVLLGARRNHDLLWASVVSSALALALTAVLAVPLEAYSLAVAMLAGNAVRLWISWRRTLAAVR